MISPDLVFLLIAGLAVLGFVLDALFDRLRVTSILPLMLVGIALLYFHVLPAGTIPLLNTLLPFLSALTIAFILFHVGLDIQFDRLYRVLGRALVFLFLVQTSTAVALALLAWSTFGWSLPIAFIFGFGLSGPSSVSVPVLVRVARMPETLGTTLLFESVVSDLLELVPPLIILELLVSGDLSTVHIAGELTLTIVGSIAVGGAAAIVWLWVLDRLGSIARTYSWTLTITMVIATYAIADYVGMSAAITIFVFGLLIGNRRHLHFDPLARLERPWETSSWSWYRFRRFLRLSVTDVDVRHIRQVQREVSFFAGAFFFVSIGLLFEFGSVTPLIIGVAVAAVFVILAIRYAATPLLSDYFSNDPKERRSDHSIAAFNISRGLSAAIVATLPLSAGLVIPGFLDATFLCILFSAVAFTVGVFLFYAPGDAPPRSQINNESEGAPVRVSEPGP